MITNGLGGVERATHELLIHHARTDTPTPFTTEGTLGHAGMLGGKVRLESEDQFAAIPNTTPYAAAKIEATAPQKRTLGITRAVRVLANAAAAPFRN